MDLCRSWRSLLVKTLQICWPRWYQGISLIYAKNLSACTQARNLELPPFRWMGLEGEIVGSIPMYQTLNKFVSISKFGRVGKVCWRKNCSLPISKFDRVGKLCRRKNWFSSVAHLDGSVFVLYKREDNSSFSMYKKKIRRIEKKSEASQRKIIYEKK